MRTNASIDGVAFHWYDSLEGTYENGEPRHRRLYRSTYHLLAAAPM